ncbi:MAG: dolichyl-phosphate beta-glucosyltransferase [Thermomicrobiales bacterium]
MGSDDEQASDAGTPPYLSIVVPAYNEAVRLPETLRTIAAYLARKPFASEIIVVDDGSTDATAALAAAVIAPSMGRVLRESHRGKGASVRAGMLAARGNRVLFTDADLAVPIEEADAMLAALDAGYGVVIGSREGEGASREGEPAFRHVMGRVFNRLVRLIAVPGIDDTQCGFKLFRADAVAAIMPRLHLYGADAPVVRGARVTGFDVEVLVIARRQGFRIHEAPVRWRYGVQSKVRPVADTFWNMRDVLRVRLNDLRGYYR